MSARIVSALAVALALASSAAPAQVIGHRDVGSHMAGHAGLAGVADQLK
jgi:hypothetical protein